MPATRTALAAALAAPLLAGLVSAGGPPVRVTVKDDKPVVVEASLPVEPGRRVQYQHGGAFNYRLTVDNKTMHLGLLYNMMHIDGQMVNPGAGGRLEVNNGALPPRPGGKARDGVMTVWLHNNLRITQTLEVVPGRPLKPAPGAKRRLDAAVFRYVVENKDTKPHKVGLRVNLDSYWVNNDGCLHAAPNFPNKILDGVELKGKDVPEYLQVLQIPNLQNPGDVAHFTFNLGSRLEPPGRIILTSLGAWRDGWEMLPRPANGDTAMGMYWDPKEIPPGGKREMAYAYGHHLATNPESDGKVEVALGGSFEPGKVFTVTAYVQDPVPGQSLTLELPAGMERVEGAGVQAVPPVDDNGNCLVLWRATVQRLGEFPLRVRSSNGVTYTKAITVSRPGAN